MIKACVGLSEDETTAVSNLLRTCESADSAQVVIQMNKSLNYHKDMNSWFLAFADSGLTGVLSAFGPLDSEVEWTGCVAPEFRCKGIFRDLMKAGNDEADRYGIVRRMYALNRKSESGQAVMRSNGYLLTQTEYSMLFPEEAPVMEIEPRLHIMRTGFGELEDMAQISAAAFEEPLEASRTMLVNSLRSSDREQYSAYSAGRMIGTVSLFISSNTAMINGLAIKTQEQGKGYGADFLAQLIRMLRRRQLRITLDVSSENAAAYRLYKRLGFVETNTTDYYERKIQGR